MKKRTGRPLMGTAPRVRVFAHVAAATDGQLKEWRDLARSDEPGARLGQVIDRLVAHGLASRWSPRKPEATP